MGSTNRIGWSRAAFVLLLVLIAVIPFLVIVGSSFKPQQQFFASPPRLWPESFTLENYAYIFDKLDTLRFLLNSLFVMGATTVLAVMFGSMAAYALSRLQYRWLFILSLFIVLVRFYPKISTVIPYYLFVRELNLLDTKLAIVISHVGIAIPLTVLMMTIFYMELPKEVEESCAIDGSNQATTYFKVVMPMTVSGMAASAILTAQLSWNEFLISSSIASVKSVTLPIAIAGFITDKGTNLGAMAAMSVMICIPMVILILFAQKYLIQGLTSGAVKG